MAIKKLQTDFTTPEQSKRLLELGVPRWSANGLQTYRGIKVLEEPQYDNPSPCWSVGRLIEITELCYGGYFNSRYFGHTLMEDILLKIEEQIDSMDFSKLED